MSGTEDVKEQVPRLVLQTRLRWFGAEILVVVFGILIAFSVDAWWSEKAERVQERELLRGLGAEFAANLELFDRTALLHRQSIEQAREMLEITGPVPPELDPATIESLLWPLISEIPSYHPAMGEVEAMLGSGQLRLIRNDRLRTAIAAWPGALKLLRETEDEMREDVIRQFFPYIITKIPLVSMDHNVGFLDTPGPSRFEADYRSLLADFVFENHVENRWVMALFILQDGEPVRALLAEVLDLIQLELGEGPTADDREGRS